MKQRLAHLLHLVFVLLAIMQCLGRPRRIYLKKAKNSLLRFLKSPRTSPQELFCPRNIEGDNFIVKTSEKINGCGDEYNLCNGDSECGPGLKCCPSGCIYKCVVPQPVRRAVATDWIEEPQPLTVGGSAWLIEGDGKGHSPEIDCSTSKFPGIEPIGCPAGYFCLIKEEEDPFKQMPNRGVCLRRKTTKDSSDFADTREKDLSAPSKGCYINGKEVPNQHVAVLKCKICFCIHEHVFCRATSCKDEIKTEQS
ncbi:uncharacterized protein LOC135688603 [Rhopilema esculentum]|uniref:uncharacterized protein LOC135688603 n=1 Tax=Rhopilema esculentum TaxID=499914 RepID=UPI0031D849C8